ncbi:MAG: PD-(D/E)XK nuclease family protein [Solirubrobacteraceae bacterium]
MNPALPPSKPIASLSPSAFETLRECRLRASFAQHAQGPGPPRTPQQALGDLCHAVLEELARSGAIRRDDWEQAIDPLWLATTKRIAGAVLAEPHDASLALAPELWPGYAIKRARLRKAAGRLHDLLAGARADAELICEAPLATGDGRLHGRPDLIVRGRDESWIVDFKSGAVMDRDRRTPREAYVRQLQLYALLEAAVSGRWPSRGFLVPLNGPVVEVPIEEAAATALGEQAHQAITDFNAVVPATQPASPSPGTCAYCPWTPICSAFWQAADASWEGTLPAAAGVVRSANETRPGSITLVVDVEAGSVSAGVITILNLSPTEHPTAMQLQAGDKVALVGLRRLQRDDELALPAWGQLALHAAGT